MSRIRGALRLLDYASGMRPAIQRSALFADGTVFYRRYYLRDGQWAARLRLRTARDNANLVQVLLDDRMVRMRKDFTDGMFDYYRCVIPCPGDGMQTQRYAFLVHSGRMTVYYDKQGPSDILRSDCRFSLLPAFRTPDWAKGSVFYQIFTDRFYNGDPTNDVLDREYYYIDHLVEKAHHWESLPQTADVFRFYGGDLQGIIDKMDYLQDLGVDVLYLNPIFVSPSNHKYDIQDYDYVDPHLGRLVSDEGRLLESWENYNSNAERYILRVTGIQNLEASNQLFIRLTQEAHRRGMRVILDGVFNHCGSFNKWMDRERIYEQQEGYEKGAFVSQDSPYVSFFRFADAGGWPYNNSFEGWWGHRTLPKLNYEDSDALEKYILRIAVKWVSPPYNADGWRLDVAADLGHSPGYNHTFWKKFRQAVKTANPDAVILAEHYGDPSSWLQGDEWDTVMNYDAFMEPVTWFLTGMEKHSDSSNPGLEGNNPAFWESMTRFMTRFHHESLYAAMNELSNHDHSRFLTRTNHKVGRLASVGSRAASEGVNPARMRLAVTMQMTWPGAPTVYYGDEAGVCGWTDPDSRRTYPWGHADQEMIRFHQTTIRIHKNHPALKSGSLIRLDDGTDHTAAYGRFDEHEKIVVAINCHKDEIRSLTLPVWKLGVPDGASMSCLLYTYATGFTTGGHAHSVTAGQISMKLTPDSAVIFCYRKPAQ